MSHTPRGIRHPALKLRSDVLPHYSYGSWLSPSSATTFPVWAARQYPLPDSLQYVLIFNLTLLAIPTSGSDLTAATIRNRPASQDSFWDHRLALAGQSCSSNPTDSGLTHRTGSAKAEQL